MGSPMAGLGAGARGMVFRFRSDKSLLQSALASGEGPTRQAVILSTHILQEVEAICQRVILINRGRKVVDAPLAELTRNQSLEEVFARETTRDVAARGDGDGESALEVPA